MFSFQEYQQVLDEVLITVGGKAYPPFGHVVIMAGGAGSGKGFVKDKLLGVEGMVFDVDAMKTLAMKSPKINQKVKDEFGVELSQLDLKKSDDVFKLHTIIGDEIKLDDKKLKTFYSSVLTAPPDRKPNIIFDVTLKSLQKLDKLSRSVKTVGYENKNIHIVWVVNDIEVALKQNQERSRRVPAEILIQTHEGVSDTMKRIIGLGKKLTSYMDGDIVFAFNKIKVDSELKKSGATGKEVIRGKGKKGGDYVEVANYQRIKTAGKSIMSLDAVRRGFGAKIASYVPKNVEWV